MYVFTLNDQLFLPHAGGKLNFTLSAGEGLIITGENGVGKTTLAQRFFQSLEIPDSAGFINQFPLTFFYDRSLGKFLSIFRQVAEAQIEESLFSMMWEGFELDKKQDRSVSTLSGGEAQCLKLLCGLSLNKELFIIDEPSQYLDQAKRELLDNILLKLRYSGRTIFMIEHDLTWISSRWKVLELKNIESSIQEHKQWTI